MKKEIEYFDLEEMAEILEIEPATLKNRISAGRNHPPVIKLGAGKYKFPKTAFYSWMNMKIEHAVAS